MHKPLLNIVIVLAPEEVHVYGDSFEAVLVRITKPSPSWGVLAYRVTSGPHRCMAYASNSPIQCMLFHLPPGARQRVVVVGCYGNAVCSAAYVTYGYTIPQSAFRIVFLHLIG